MKFKENYQIVGFERLLVLKDGGTTNIHVGNEGWES